ncbi:hypothetical protein JHK84_030622 [Glycine max]|nr:hypothetical protein JHK85_031036 [Glycine max]KAG5145079.1 hypothetical protein JHK84_030622 [Glycine max]KHN41856.1 hypothetical protein glysoja_003596 [Glycine soja]
MTNGVVSSTQTFGSIAVSFLVVPRAEHGGFLIHVRCDLASFSFQIYLFLTPHGGIMVKPICLLMLIK